MSRKKIIVPLVLVLAIACYFVFFHKDKSLQFVPENADAVALVDVKKLTRQYISSFITHPSQWFEGKKQIKREVL
jgi:multidrug resistance efflux pump